MSADRESKVITDLLCDPPVSLPRFDPFVAGLVSASYTLVPNSLRASPHSVINFVRDGFDSSEFLFFFFSFFLIEIQVLNSSQQRKRFHAYGI